MSAYSAIENEIGQGHLLRYYLTQPSSVSDIDDGVSTLSVAQTGELWMFVANTYILANNETDRPHLMKLYFEDVSEVSNTGGPDELAFGLSNEALLAGEGFSWSSCCGFPFTPPQPETMDAYDLFPCLASGCTASGLLNLLFLEYTVLNGFLGVLEFDSTPSEYNLVYQQVQAFEGSRIRTFAVGAVPTPAAAWLFGSALGLLSWIQRKASSSRKTTPPTRTLPKPEGQRGRACSRRWLTI